MTPAKRKKHIEAIKQILENYGFKEDAYGNFLYPRVPDYRVKIKKVNIRFEQKRMGIWVSANYSEVISQLTLAKFDLDVRAKVAILKDRAARLSNETKTPVKDPSIKAPTKTVSLLGPHMEKPEVQANVAKLIEERNHCDYQCFLILQKLLELGLVIPPSSPNTYMDVDDFSEEETTVQEDAAKMVAKRIEINEQFIKAMIGR